MSNSVETSAASSEGYHLCATIVLNSSPKYPGPHTPHAPDLPETCYIYISEPMLLIPVLKRASLLLPTLRKLYFLL